LSSIALDECLSVRNGHLFIEDCDTVDLARRYGTPVYVVSEDHLRRNARRFSDAFESRWTEGPVNVLASLKANYSLAVRRILTQEGLGCDTFGPGELYAALRCGVPPELISVNGSVKDQELIDQAVEAGARVTLDSEAELDRVRRAAHRLGTRASVRFRVRPDYEEIDELSEFYAEEVPIKVAAQRYKPGIPTEELLAMGPRALSMNEIEVTGLMVHLGRHHHDLDVWRAMVRSFMALVHELSRSWGGWQPKELDLGGGFPTARDPFGRALPRLASRSGDHGALPIEAYAEAITTSLRDELVRRGLSWTGVTLEVEPGRSLYADTGIHLATVRHVKSQTRPQPMRWVETDTTEMFLPDGFIEHNLWRACVAGKCDQPAAGTVAIVGRSCGFDEIVSDASLPEVDCGDIVAFLDTGAYQDAGSGNFNALPRPATVLVRGRTAELIKRAETVSDVFRRDRIPARLEDERLFEESVTHTIRLDDEPADQRR
jgi:diaminopimelate decarboxylase